MVYSSKSYYNKNILHSDFKTQVSRQRAFVEQINNLNKNTGFSIEGPVLNTMYEKLAFMLQQPGLVEILTRCCKQTDRGLLAKNIIQELLKFYENQRVQIKIDKILKVILGVYTEGVVIAPLDGLCRTRIDTVGNFPIMQFAGPIRASGGTVMGVIVMCCAYLIQKLNLNKYVATEQQVERNVSECLDYVKLHPTQIRPSAQQIEHVVRHCPVMIDGPSDTDSTGKNP